ncbi:protein sidekick-1-like [Sycon ciliatum]|uniref:protein sidekick-1-like n=1 Tax=Sycon ciliatum TaxID=27933 RepID=UPI0031F66AB2
MVRKDVLSSHLLSHLVYQFECRNCGSRYVGRTLQHLTARIKQHVPLHIPPDAAKSKRPKRGRPRKNPPPAPVLKVLEAVCIRIHTPVLSGAQVASVTKSTSIKATGSSASRFMIQCNITGDTPLVLRWFKNGKVLANASGRADFSPYLNTFNFPERLTATDSGNYTCVAENIFGNNSRSMMLLVLDVPEFLQRAVQPMIEPNSLTSSSVTLFLTPPSSDGNSPVTEYEVTAQPYPEFRQFAQAVMLTTPVLSADVSGLRSGMKYSAFYRAINAVGYSAATSEVHFKTLESLPGPPQNMQAVATSSGGITVSITPTLPSNAHGVVTGYVISYQASVCAVTGECPCHGYKCSLFGVVPLNEGWSLSLVGLRYLTTYQVTAAAVNSVGAGQRVTATITTGQSRIGPVRNASFVATSPGEVTLHFMAPNTVLAHDKMTGYELKYKAAECSEPGDCPCSLYTCSLQGSADLGSTEYSVTIRGLRHYTKYRFTIAGVSESAVGETVTVHVTTAQYIPSDITSVWVNVTSSLAKIYWKQPEEPNGIVLYYQLQYTLLFGDGQNSTARGTVNVSADTTEYTNAEMLASRIDSMRIAVLAVNAIGSGHRSAVIACRINGVLAVDTVCAASSNFLELVGTQRFFLPAGIVGGSIVIVIIIIIAVKLCRRRHGEPRMKIQKKGPKEDQLQDYRVPLFVQCGQGIGWIL